MLAKPRDMGQSFSIVAPGGIGLLRLLLPLLATVTLQTAEASARPAISPANLMGELAKLQSGQDGPQACQAEVAAAAGMNTADLLYGFGVCTAAGRLADSNFLLLASQVRFQLDVQTLPPEMAEPAADPIEALPPAAELYGILFYQLGGLGHDDVYIDAEQTKAMLAMFAAWAPVAAAGYDPGWKVAPPTKPEAFAATLAELKERRRAQAVTYSRLLADPAYLALHREHQTLQQRNPGGFIVGTPDAARSDELLKAMAAF